MDWLLVGVTIVLGLPGFVYLYSKWKHSYWNRKGVPQLNPKMFYGDAKDMVTGEKSLGQTGFDFYQEFKKNDVKFGGAYIVFRPVFVPIAPELIKDIMQKNFDHFASHFPKMSFDRSVISRNLFNLEDEEWRQTRKELTPTFTSGKMKMMFETLLEKTIGLDKLVGHSITGEPVNIKNILERFTSDVVGSCGFGIDCNAMNDPNSEFLKNGRLIFDPPKTKDNYWGLFLRAIGIRRMRKDLTPADNFFKNIVNQTINYREKHNIYRKDFMHLMIQLKNRGQIVDDDNIFKDSRPTSSIIKFNEDYITAQCAVFYLAGFETSASTMTFAILELAQNQDIQEKVRKEANEILKKYDGKMTYDAMLELKYTEKVIQETLRKYPPLGVIPRHCTKNYTIPGTDIVIEKGTSTFISAWGLHMNPEYFPDPEKFDPERFNEENRKKNRDFTYMPFGEGPRMCLGLRFGMMQTKVGLASVVRNYNFTLNPKTTFPLKMLRETLTTSVDGGIWVDIKKAE